MIQPPDRKWEGWVLTENGRDGSVLGAKPPFGVAPGWRVERTAMAAVAADIRTAGTFEKVGPTFNVLQGGSEWPGFERDQFPVDTDSAGGGVDFNIAGGDEGGIDSGGHDIVHSTVAAHQRRVTPSPYVTI
eukprot:COSAG05_NODE_459_length_9617_cov_12.484661_11_plen_131_part_00